MDEHRKNAYRSLLYKATLQIRPLAWRTRTWWNPFSTRRVLRQAKLAGALADAIHNLGFFAAHNFERFDEEQFWDEMQAVKDRYSEFQVDEYRSYFEMFLARSEE